MVIVTSNWRARVHPWKVRPIKMDEKFTSEFLAEISSFPTKVEENRSENWIRMKEKNDEDADELIVSVQPNFLKKEKKRNRISSFLLFSTTQYANACELLLCIRVIRIYPVITLEKEKIFGKR